MAYNRNIDLLRLISDPTGDDEILAIDRTGADGEQVRIRISDLVRGGHVILTQGEYDALPEKNPSALYLIVEG